MATRPRTPDYPSLSLKEAIDKARLLHEAIGQHPTSREMVAKGMGYSGLSGASAGAVAALKKYGLLEGRGDDIRISDRAMAILHPHSDAEKAAAVREAAHEPELFREIADRFPGPNVGDELLKNYLYRNNFAPSGVSSVVSTYKETLEFVNAVAGGYDSAPETDKELESMQNLEPVRDRQRGAGDIQDEVKIGELGFQGVGSVRIVASRSLTTQKALSMAETVIRMMREELKEQDNLATADEAQEEEDETFP